MASGRTIQEVKLQLAREAFAGPLGMVERTKIAEELREMAMASVETEAEARAAYEQAMRRKAAGVGAASIEADALYERIQQFAGERWKRAQLEGGA